MIVETRLICVQGPSQLLDVLSVLLFQKEEEKSSDVYNDILIIGGLNVLSKNDALLDIESIVESISKLWDFNSIHNITNIESILDTLLRERETISKLLSAPILKISSRLLRKTINVTEVDKIYVCRNWQTFNELMLFSFPRAEKICYGDMGHLDINDKLQKKSLLNPDGFIEVDKCYLMLPVEVTENTFNTYKLKAVNPVYKKKIIDNICKCKLFGDLANFCEENLKHSVLVTTSNGTEAGIYNSVLDEVQLYLSCVLANTNTGDVIWVKPHPRQTLNQSKILCHELKKNERIAYCIEEFGRYPLELFIPYLSSTRLICLYSYSGIVAALLGQKDLICGFEDNLITAFVKKEFHNSFKDFKYSYANLLHRVSESNFNPIYNSELLSKQVDTSILGGSNVPLFPSSPLTNSNNVVLLKEYATSSLIQKWMDVYDINIAPEIKGYFGFYLYQCMDTKLKFFFPEDINGSDKLYKQLQKFNWYYMPHKWEHKIALKHILGSNDILEVGCAFGSFIESALKLGLNVKGIELNPAAVEIAKSKNLPVENIDLQDFAKRYPLSQDAICSFQVLEHISKPREFIELCLQILKPNGKLIFCVPNAQSFLKYQYNLLDMPPHHMTQWEISTFQSLENIFPLKLQQKIKEPLAGYHTKGYVDAYSNHFCSNFPIAKILFNRYSNLIYSYVLNLGLRKFFTGQSLYVQFQKLDEIS